LPVGADRVPAVAQTLRIGVAVLRNDRSDPVRMLHGETEAYGSAVVEDVDRVAIEADHLGEAVDHLSHPVEAMTASWHLGISEARQVRSDEVEAIAQKRDQVPKHVAGGRKAMQQQELRRARRNGLAVEDLQAVHVHGAIVDVGQGASPRALVTELRALVTEL